jgi:hypothetical protein
LTAADDPWFEHSVRLATGRVNAPLEVDAAGEYGSAALDGERVLYGGLVLRTTRWNEFELGISSSGASGIQTGKSWPTGGVDTVDMDCSMDALWFTWRLRLAPAGALVAPWLGCGLHIGRVKGVETETTLAEDGAVRETTTRSGDTFYGIHPTVGFDLYPRPDSAFAVTVEAQRMFSHVGGDSRYRAGGTLLTVGIRWNFWQGG